MHKPKILIAMHYLEIGGAEMALIGLLNAFDYDRVNVDLFIYSHRGEFMKYIPEQVNLLHEIKEYAMIESPIKTALMNRCFGVVAGRLKAKVFHWKYLKRSKNKDGNAIFSYIGKYVTPYLPKINDSNYDLAISFLTPHNIVLNKVNARKKICWIHTDYSKIDLDTEIELPVWSKFDNIISISQGVTEAFTSVFPTISDKIIEIENIIPDSIIQAKALQTIPQEFGVMNFNLLSIGRFTYPKNFDNIPNICRQLINITGLTNIRWYLIGFGGDENLIRKCISEYNMESHVIILGKKENPYPYIKACDLYVQPSRYEGKSITVREAQLLGKPVVITDYPTAKSQIESGVDGIIVPLNNLECAKGIAKVITDKQLMLQITKALPYHDYSNKSEISKLYAII